MDATLYSSIKADPTLVVQSRELLERELGRFAPDFCLGVDGKIHASASTGGLWMVQSIMLLQLTQLFGRLPLLLPKQLRAQYAERMNSAMGAFLTADEFMGAAGCLLRACVVVNRDKAAAPCDFGAWAMMARMRELNASGTSLPALAMALRRVLHSIEVMALDQASSTLGGPPLSALSFHPTGFPADGAFEDINLLKSHAEFVWPCWLSRTSAAPTQSTVQPHSQRAGMPGPVRGSTSLGAPNDWCKFGTTKEAIGRHNTCAHTNCARRHPATQDEARQVIDALVAATPGLANQGWSY